MLDTVLNLSGYGLCHQLPARTISAAGHLLPVCARDTGIYIGFVASVLVATLLDRGERSAGGLPWGAWWVVGLYTMAITLDVATSYGGLRESTNLLRLATGLCGGFALGLVAVPVVASQLWDRPGSRLLLSHMGDILVWTVSLAPVFALGWWVLPLTGRFYQFLVAFCVVATYTYVNVAIVCALTPLGRVGRPRDGMPALAVAGGLAIAEIAAAAALKAMLVSTLTT